MVLTEVLGLVSRTLLGLLLEGIGEVDVDVSAERTCLAQLPVQATPAT